MKGGLAAFFQQAHDLASREHRFAQIIIRDLASEGGLRRIGELEVLKPASLNDAALANSFRAEVFPLYRMLSHPNVEGSALLEDSVATIYTYLFSPKGHRAVALFKAVIEFLRTIAKQDASDEERGAADWCLCVMAKMMELNGSADTTEPFVSIVAELSTIFDTAVNGGEPFSRPASKDLDKIKKLLNIGQKLSSVTDGPEIVDQFTSTTPCDPPGELSIAGPRHDNDRVSIRDIKILHTLAEILASRDEYLPTIDPSKWHVRGMEGLLDRQFRLVREDTVGQLRDSVKYELERLSSASLPEGQRDISTVRARTFIYDNVRFETCGFDETKGPEFVVSFDQPFDFRTTSEQDRMQIWEDSQRLGSEALVCLIDAAGVITYLIVSVPQEIQGKAGAMGKRHSSKKLQGQDAKAAQKDTVKKQKRKPHYLYDKYTRYKDRKRAHAVLRFIDVGQDTARQVESFFDSQNRGAYMELVEFPGVLVPAFQPVLAALQKMSAHSDFPFADIVYRRTLDLISHHQNTLHLRTSALISKPYRIKRTCSCMLAQTAI